MTPRACRRFALLAATSLLATPSLAQVAVRGETVYTMAGAPLKDAVVLVNKDGRIEKVELWSFRVARTSTDKHCLFARRQVIDEVRSIELTKYGAPFLQALPQVGKLQVGAARRLIPFVIAGESVQQLP